MSRIGVGLASLLLSLTLAGPAAAQSGNNGLYEPFPSAASKARAKRFVNKLHANAAGAPVPSADLQHGSFVGRALEPVPRGAASARANAGVAPSSSLGSALALALLAACATSVLGVAAIRRG